MKVRVSSIPAEGLEIKDTIPLQSLNARMNEGRDNDIQFTQAPQINLKIVRTTTGAQTSGTVKSKYTQPCSRCVEVVEKEVEVEANFILAPIPPKKSKRGKNSGESESEDSDTNFDYEDDIGVSYYEGDVIDLEETIQEALILSLSRYWHPPVDKNGACIRCGLNISEENKKGAAEGVTLGALIKKAQLQ